MGPLKNGTNYELITNIQHKQHHFADWLGSHVPRDNRDADDVVKCRPWTDNHRSAAAFAKS